MNVYELRVAGVEGDARVRAARWALFVCHEIRDVRRGRGNGTIEIVYEGEAPRAERWLRVLEQAGYQSEDTGSRLDAA